ncbi:type II toxin-antitoxin system RelE/ParE family toxin [Photorhabdus sp. CRCIA-P01]|uniref:type II toxin-antitoxin system RelE/ParE family toxin n=1 Tax=Photorhabdus sp. CRCIA-P01 TaxID=2019570 RepID=UPI000E59BAF3
MSLLIRTDKVFLFYNSSGSYVFQTHPRSNNYERLSGNLDGCSSIRVSIQWRLIFRWRDGHAYDLYLDPHKY